MSTVNPLIPLIVPDNTDPTAFANTMLTAAKEFLAVSDQLLEAGVFTGQYRRQLRTFQAVALRATQANFVAVHTAKES